MSYSTRDKVSWWSKTPTNAFTAGATAAILGVLLSGCASNDRIESGGVMYPQVVPANAMQCQDVDWRTAERVPPRFPGALGPRIDPGQDWSMALSFSFDVEPDGSTGNIRFLEPSEYTRHAASRTAIRRSAEAISQWRFEHDGAAVHVTGCTTTIEFGSLAQS